MENTIGLHESIDADFSENVIIVPPKINRIWGVDYMIMDSNSFKAGTGRGNYSQIIDMLQNLWNVYNCRLFSGF
jgi:hypothetical protein